MLIGAMREYFRGLKFILLFVIVAFIATSLLFYFGSGSLAGATARARARPGVGERRGDSCPRASSACSGTTSTTTAGPTSRTSPRRWRSGWASPSRSSTSSSRKRWSSSRPSARASRVSDEELPPRIQTIPGVPGRRPLLARAVSRQLKQARIDPAEFEARSAASCCARRWRRSSRTASRCPTPRWSRRTAPRYERVRADWAYVEVAPLMAAGARSATPTPRRT